MGSIYLTRGEEAKRGRHGAPIGPNKQTLKCAAFLERPEKEVRKEKRRNRAQLEHSERRTLKIAGGSITYRIPKIWAVRLGET